MHQQADLRINGILGYHYRDNIALGILPNFLYGPIFKARLEGLKLDANLAVINGKCISAALEFHQPVELMSGYKTLQSVGEKVGLNLTESTEPAMKIRSKDARMFGYDGDWRVYVTHNPQQSIDALYHADVFVYGATDIAEVLDLTCADEVEAAFEDQQSCGGQDYYIRKDGWTQWTMQQPFVLARKYFEELDLDRMAEFLRGSITIGYETKHWIGLQNNPSPGKRISARRMLSLELLARLRH